MKVSVEIAEQRTSWQSTLKVLKGIGDGVVDGGVLSYREWG